MSPNTYTSVDGVVIDSETAEVLMGGIIEASSPQDGPTDIQGVVATALARSLWDATVDPWNTKSVSPAEFSAAAAPFPEPFRVRLAEAVSMLALLLPDLPEDVAEATMSTVNTLGVPCVPLPVAKKYSSESHQAALFDFARNGYVDGYRIDQTTLHTRRDLGDGWAQVTDDPDLAKRWEGLRDCAEGTLGRGVYDFYASRHFSFPGTPDSAPPLLAQHDWIHVLADFGTTLPSELEVFGFIAFADTQPRSFSLLAMVLGLFESGTIERGAGFFDVDPGHLREPGVPTRLADAIRRGMQACHSGSPDGGLLGIDWFAYADVPTTEVRAIFTVPSKSDEAIQAGSAGPWSLKGFSDYQLQHCDLSVIDRYLPTVGDDASS